MPGKDDNASENLGIHKYEKSIPEVQYIKKNYRDLIGKNSDIRSYIRNHLSKRIS